MSTNRPPLTPAEHIARAKETLAEGANPAYATAHALVAIAEAIQVDTFDVIDLDEHERRQPPVLLTQRQLDIAVDELMRASGDDFQPHMTPTEHARQIVQSMIRAINEGGRQ